MKIIAPLIRWLTVACWVCVRSVTTVCEHRYDGPERKLPDMVADAAVSEGSFLLCL